MGAEDSCSRTALTNLEKTKGKTRAWEEGRFDLNIWRNALSEQLRAKYARHEKRNEKRLRMGLAPTTWEQPVMNFYPEFETRDESSGEEDMSSGDDDDDDDDDGNDDEKGRSRERPENAASNSLQANPLSTTEPDHDMANKQRPQKAFDESQSIHPPYSTPISGIAPPPGPEPPKPPLSICYILTTRCSSKANSRIDAKGAKRYPYYCFCSYQTRPKLGT
ncbi:unnamed protein product [Clonostachys rosea f. rosea IK726]|uniref:Uncharacterized protein n=1 Tax=Clonostachys rosea f. rosea IK726 TaxID=1349383 RepID=A0ACA9UDM1_BIOOC|nr:unnamed protein product [Clonostachys rosea f. rosea IK726]